MDGQQDRQTENTENSDCSNFPEKRPASTALPAKQDWPAAICSQSDTNVQ